MSESNCLCASGCREQLPNHFRVSKAGRGDPFLVAEEIQAELNWRPAETFGSGLRKTVCWYLNNRRWWQAFRADADQSQRLRVTD
jgi:hypothetical protein